MLLQTVAAQRMRRLAASEGLVAIATVEGNTDSAFPLWGGGGKLGDWRKLGQASGTNNNIYMPHFVLSMKSRVQ